MTNGASYDVQVRAANARGDGAWSPSATLKAGLPAAPAAPGLVSGNIQLEVDWTAPSNNGSAITDYDVQYKLTGASTWTEWDASTTSTTTSDRITGLTNGSEYDVQVRATNSVGDSGWSPSATLKAGLPDELAAPTLSEDNAQLDVSWTAPTNNGGSAITDYDVRYKRSSDSSWTEWKASTTSTALTATITGLTNDTSYDVQVRAQNANGNGPWSPSSSDSPEAQRPDAPSAPTLTKGDRQIAVSWTAPANNGANITDYDVQYSSDSGANWTEWNASDDSATLTATITGLTNGTEYDVQVLAANSEGDSDWSASASATPATTPAAPAKPTLTAGNGQIAVAWAAPTDNGGSAISDYDVEYRDAGTTTWTDLSHTGTGRTATITSLINGATYFVRVQATNGEGDSAWSSPASASPYGYEPTNVSVTQGDTTLTITWSAPTGPSAQGQAQGQAGARSNSSATVTGYVARYRESGTTQWNESATLAATATSHTFTNLNNTKTYESGVSATTTQNQETQTSQYVSGGEVSPNGPTAPRGLDVSAEGDGSFYVVWAPPATTNGAITDYDLRYRVVGAANWTLYEPNENSNTRLLAWISGLTNGSTYEVQVRADNSSGPGPWSDSETAKAGAPGYFTRPTINQGVWDIVATWKAPSDPGGSAITDYDVQYLNATALPKTSRGLTIYPMKYGFIDWDALPWIDWQKSTVSLTKRAHITGLIAGTAYWTRVRAVNSYGAGPWTDVGVTRTYIPSTTKICVPNGVNTLPLTWICDIKSGVGGAGAFDTATITAGSENIVAGRLNGADWAYFHAFNPDGGNSTVTTYKDGAVVDTFDISVTPFGIASIAASASTVSAGDAFYVDVALTSPYNRSPGKNMIDSDRNPIAGKYSRSWVKLDLPTGWTATGNSEGTASAPIEVVDYHGNSVSFTVNVPSNATGGLKTINVTASTLDLPDGCAADPNCYEDLSDQEVAGLGVTVAGGLVAMSVSGPDPAPTPTPEPTPTPTPTPEPTPAEPPAAVTGLVANRVGSAIVASWNTIARRHRLQHRVQRGRQGKLDARRHQPPGTSYTIEGAKDDHGYVVAVQAVNDAGASGWTNSSRVPEKGKPAPPDAVGAVAVVHEGNYVTAKWTAANRAAGYDVVYSTDGKNSWKRAATNHKDTTYTLYDADPEKTYVIAVRAANDAGESPWTNSQPAAQK